MSFIPPGSTFYIVWGSLVLVLLCGLFVYKLFPKYFYSKWILRQKLGQIQGTGFFSFFNPLFDLTYGEAFCLLILILMLLLRFLSYYFDFPSWSKESNSGVSARFARSLGELNFVMMGFVILPAAKNSLWGFLAGISFERAIKFHRWWARAMVIVMGVHGFGMLIAYSNPPDGAKDIAYALKFEIEESTGWSNLSGLLCWIFLATATIFTLPFVRRNYFQVFRYPHIMFSIIGFVFGGLHMPSLITWCIPALLLFGIDMTIRMYRAYFKGISVLKIAALSDGVIMVQVQMYKGFTFTPGQFCMLNFPSFSHIAFHPFSLSCARSEENDVITFHIKSMNNHTKMLYDIAKRCNEKELQLSVDEKQNEKSFHLRIDGPYGIPSIPLFNYRTIVLCCGGIGVTPCMSILHDLLKNKFKDVLNQAAIDAHIRLLLYVSRPDDEQCDIPTIRGKRPNFGEIFCEIQKNNEDAETAVFACGPPQMIVDVQSNVFSYSNLHFHKEIFLL